MSVVLDDPLAAPVSEPSPLLSVGPPWHPRRCVPIGRLSDGALLAPQLLGQHWLIAGMTGTGKSTTGQSVAVFLTLCSPGTARAVVLDPKGGAEFGWLAQSGIAPSVVGADVQQACCAASGRAETEPGIIDPLIVVLIDEAAAYRRDTKHRDEFDRLLTLLAEQGRSSAISLELLTQTPSVETPLPASATTWAFGSSIAVPPGDTLRLRPATGQRANRAGTPVACPTARSTRASAWPSASRPRGALAGSAPSCWQRQNGSTRWPSPPGGARVRDDDTVQSNEPAGRR